MARLPRGGTWLPYSPILQRGKVSDIRFTDVKISRDTLALFRGTMFENEMFYSVKTRCDLRRLERHKQDNYWKTLKNEVSFP